MDHYAAGWKITIAAALEMFLHLDAMAKIYLTFLRRICAIYICNGWTSAYNSDESAL